MHLYLIVIGQLSFYLSRDDCRLLSSLDESFYEEIKPNFQDVFFHTNVTNLLEMSFGVMDLVMFVVAF